MAMMPHRYLRRTRGSGIGPGLAACVLLLPSAAQAQQSDRDHQRRFYLRLAAARVIFDEKADVKLAGQVLSGANATASSNNGVSIELGYFLTPDVSIAATVGVPPTSTLTASGTLAGAGTLGKVTYGPGLYSLRYHLGRPGGVRPYIGGGLNWTIIFKTEDGVLKDFRTTNTVGPAITGGIDVPINARIGIFGAASKVWTSTNARFRLGTPGGLVPGTARVQLNPLIVQLGLQYRF
jgi:outer membrane protein